MKKLIALLLALTMVASLAACGNDTPVETTPAETTPAETTPAETTAAPVQIASALELLSGAFNAYANPENRPPLGGGSGDTMSYEGPGAVAATDTDTLTYQLKVPADLVGNVTDAASLMHMMNGNNFTAAAFHVSGDQAAFVTALKDSVLGTHWMCGFPEQLVIVTVGEYVVMAYGLAGVAEPEANFVGDFITALTVAYPTATVVVEQEIL